MFNRRCMRQDPFIGMMPEANGLIDIDNNSGNIDIDFAQTQNLTATQNTNVVQNQSPVMEPRREGVVHKTIENVVAHVCQVRKRVINHHVYKHTYQPSYTCCEENVCEHVQCGSCCNF